MKRTRRGARVGMAAVWCLAGVAAGAGAPLAAQGRWVAQIQPAWRADLLVARITAVQGAVGLGVPAGRYLRLAATGGIGSSWSRDSSAGLSARVELTGRFVLDPTFTRRWTPYAGGGLGARYDQIEQWRGVLVAFLGLEGPRWGGVVPFVEAGYGGGGRLGFGIRTARAHGR